MLSLLEISVTACDKLIDLSTSYRGSEVQHSFLTSSFDAMVALAILEFIHEQKRTEGKSGAAQNK